jgi:DegV family protein with EDD domain
MSLHEIQPIRVLTDIGTSMRQDNPLVNELGVKIVPLHVIFPDGTDRTADTLSDTEFYAGLTRESIPTTSAPNVSQYEKAYQELFDEGAETILSIHMSGEISGTLPNAESAAQSYISKGKNIEVINTKTLSLAEWFVVQKAAGMAKSGESLPSINSAIDNIIPRVGLVAVFETLDYFKRGGRMAHLKKLMASLLSLTPVLGFDQNGVITTLKSFDRSVKSARKNMIEIVKQQGELLQAAIIHSNAPLLAEEIRDNLSSHFAGVMGLFDVGPTLAVHGGPNIVGICWESKNAPTK